MLLMAPMVCATEVKNLYSATVQGMTPEKEEVLLERAYARSAEDVLARVSGQVDALDDALLAQAHKLAASWVAQHSIEGNDIKVSFYPESIDHFLYQAGLPVWGANRPSLLVWMIEETDQGRVIYGSNHSDGALAQFFDRAGALGLPVFAPLADDSDQQSLSSSELWGLFQEDIRAASERYDTDITVALRVGRNGDQYTFEGLLLYPEQTVRLAQTTAPTKEQGLSEVVDTIAAALSNRFASSRAKGETDAFIIRVEGVMDYQSMVKVERYLNRMEVVRQVQLETVAENSVEFALTLDGSVQAFTNGVSLSSLLRLKPVSALDPQANRITILELKR